MENISATDSRREFKAVAFGWSLIFAFVVTAATLIDYREHLRIFQVGWLVGLSGYALIVRTLVQNQSNRLGSWHGWMFGIFLIRIVLLHTVPSDDLHRYVWEGKIQLYGLNPYTTVPLEITEPELTTDDPNWASINHPDYPAIYPPLTQLVFRATSWFSDSVYGAKTWMVLFELCAIGLFGKWLIACNRSPHWAVVYALNPLAISAVAIDGHQDALMLFALAIACLTAQRKKWWWCGIWLGVAISTKTVALVLAPWLLFRRPAALLATTFVIALCYVPFANAGWRVFDSLLRFGDTTTSLGLWVTTFEPLLGERPARVVGAMMLAGFALWLAAKKLDLPTFATRVFAGLVLVLPVVHAWYLTWMLFFACARLRYAWLVLCGAAFVYFEADGLRAATGTWSMPAWVFTAWYAPFALAWIIEVALRSRDRADASR